MNNKGWCFSIIIYMFFSCGEKAVFQEYKKIANQKWNTDTIIKFNYLITDTTARYKAMLKVRHTTDYEYQNLFLFSHTEETKDTIEIVLSDKKGKWKGKGVGDIRETCFLLEGGKIFNKKGNKKYFFEQAMRYGSQDKINNLRNIDALGLSITKE